MSTYRLDSIFRPRAVAVVGSQSRPRSVGRAVIGNLLAAGFDGKIGLVNRHPTPMAPANAGPVRVNAWV